MKKTPFIALLRNGHGGIAYLTQDCDDYRGTLSPEFTITRRAENAHHFATYSEALDALLATDTTGWKFSEIEPAREEA